MEGQDLGAGAEWGGRGFYGREGRSGYGPAKMGKNDR